MRKKNRTKIVKEANMVLRRNCTKERGRGGEGERLITGRGVGDLEGRVGGDSSTLSSSLGLLSSASVSTEDIALATELMDGSDKRLIG